MRRRGIIFKGIGGFYYVRSGEELFECRAKGRFRKEGIVPLAGDDVEINVGELTENTIEAILPRKNFLRRPPVANIDRLFIVVSTCEPVPNTLVIDRLTVLCEKNGIEPVIVLSKADKMPADELFLSYSKTGYRIVYNSEREEILSLISGKLSAFTGNSGVGKSTLLNSLCPGLDLKTAPISEKLGRGRHTTRQAEIFELGDGLVIDTAGFSALDFCDSEMVPKEELQFLFPEFSEHLGECRFTGCSHVNDSGCRIRELAESGEISASRHASYVFLFNEAKNHTRYK